MNILLLNGAPRSGKDTVAKILKNMASTVIHLEKFAMPMKRSLPLMYSVPWDVWEKDLDTAENKDLPCPQFFGKTPREVQIALSENFLKTMHGKYVFGHLLIRRIEFLKERKITETVVVSDSGFKEEAVKLIEHFGAEKITLWRINREGCNFKNDSRGFISLMDYGVPCYDIFNNTTLTELREVVQPLYLACFAPPEADKEGKIESSEDLRARRKELVDSILRKHHAQS